MFRREIGKVFTNYLSEWTLNCTEILFGFFKKNYQTYGQHFFEYIFVILKINLKFESVTGQQKSKKF